VFRGDVAAREFVALWVKDDRVAAAMSCYIWDVVEQLRSLITERRVVDDALLRDPDVALLAPR
jgi:3-phenylpropionate/trans-cinnamate dioxygenase ferredoxin reductase subunit